MKKILGLSFIIIFLLTYAQTDSSQPVLHIKLRNLEKKGNILKINLHFSLEKNFILQKEHIKILNTNFYTIEKVKYKNVKKIKLWGEEIEGFTGKDNDIEIQLKLLKNTKTLILKLEYQLCSLSNCYPPQEKEITVELKQSKSSEKTEKLERKDKYLKLFRGKNPLILILMLFFLGILSSFTPCIYPMIPITIGILGINKENTFYKNFLRSFIYVSGITITYSILGVLSSFAGFLFGNWLSNKYVIIFSTIIFILLALNSMELLSFNISFGTSAKKGKGFISLFLIGLTAGLFMSPCIGPILIGLLLFISQIKNPILGFIYMLSYGYGLGFILLITGTFSGYITFLPHAGNWMNEVKKILGIILLLIPLYFWQNILTKSAFLLFCAFFIISIPILAGYHRDYFHKNGHFLKGLITVFCYFFALYLIVRSSVLVSEKVNSPLKEYSYKNIIQLSKKENKIILLDFSAEWCAYCKIYDRYFEDEEVKKQLKFFKVIKIDYEKNKDLVRVFDIKGVPTLIFLKNGKELRKYRIISFIPKNKFINLLKEIYESNNISN